MTQDLVSKEGVRAMLDDLQRRVSGWCPSTDEAGRTAIRVAWLEILKGLSQLPSVSAPSGEVRFDDAAILRTLHAWFEDPKATHDLPESFKSRMRSALLANTLISDTPAGEK